MSLEKFIRLADNLVEFEAALNGNELPVTSICLIETHRDEAKSLWSRLKLTYEKCLADMAIEKSDGGGAAQDLESVKEKYKNSYCTYCRCVSKLTESIQTVSSSNMDSSQSFNLPPIELNVFQGDFKSWPTFRDIFTAICVRNPRLSPVEKLFHLSQKTKGEAHEIVAKSPLTNEGFQTAWKNLCARYDNKRVLINEQLKTLFSLSAIHTESANSLKQLQRDINSCISTLGSHEIDTESWNPIFIFLCSNCLPDSTLTLWEQTLSDKTSIPKWSDFDDFLTNRHRTLESVSEIKGSKEPNSSNHKSKGHNNFKAKSDKVRAFQAQVNQATCKLCPKEVHVIRKCPKFLNMNHDKRLAEIKKHNLCLNCFSGAHAVKECKSKHSCYKCSKRHNTLLHRETEQRKGPDSVSFGTNQSPRGDALPPPFVPQPSTSNLQSTNTASSVVQTCFASNSKGVLLGTAMIRIILSGVVYRARALLDSGSEGTFISEKLSNLLKLPTKRISATISGLNNSISAAVQKECRFVIGSEMNKDFELVVSAIVVPHLSNNLPSGTIDIRSLSDLPPLPLADPRFFESAKVDLLLGADVFPSVMLSRNQHNICGSLMAQETVFGWILTGPISPRMLSSFSTQVSFFCEISLDKEISRFWEVENVPQKRFPSQDDRFCEALYRKTTLRNDEGRYVVSLPFKVTYPDGICLGHSRSNAMAQFFRNEARLLRHAELKKEYDNTLLEYLTLNHMFHVETPGSSVPGTSYFLPHHAVIKPERTTTKVRVVFNASSPSSNGVSLNDILYTGPVLQNDLTVLILKWRFYRFVLNGDIQKMYRQILVNPSHTPFQRILFRKCQNDPIREFELKTVTFGLNCAPYLAIRTMVQLADDVHNQYPLASRILKECMYVDDALVGAHSIQMAIDTRDELIQALNSAGFEMRKWISNVKCILEGLPSDHLLCGDLLEFEDRSSAKTLGIHWNAHSDEFFFATTQFPTDCSYTKREVLSQISKLFDPAGWLSPIIIIAKIIMQRIWMDHVEWDEIISSEPLSMWKAFQSKYSQIDHIKIPRWVDYSPGGTIEFHGFSDASEKAYAAAIYVRVIYPNSISAHLISSKTKVAPLKTLSIPRLELCGATLLAEMVDNLIPQFDVQKFSLFCWTDSTIVLSWLAKPPCCWNTFVANRVSKITQVVDPSKWSHVDSESNPADLASRGAYPDDLISNKLWWNGPMWLSKSSKYWPKSFIDTAEETDLEKKPIKVHFSYFQNFEDILDRFSSFSRALRVVAYIYRFYFNTHPKFRSNYHRPDKIITNSEILYIRKTLVSICQKAFYPNEYMALNSKKPISSTSSLLSLNPFIDAEGIMRICGRLELSPMLSYNERHPILLPYSCQYSRLLILFIHQISLHGGNQLVLRLVRTQYWIPKVQNLIKTTIHRCKTCIIYKKKCQQQLMAALPPERCEVSRPFTHTGLDFAGPFEMKSYAGRFCRMSKAYVCVFVCFSTKAIHLETTSDLSTSCFLAAFSRFISRRGCPLHIHSDNGTTFVGASKIIAKEFIQTSQKAVTANYSHQNLTWHFIPPGAPHMGGLWEAGVKSFKQHFKKTIGLQKFTFEEFQTLLSKIEACLNSRPISPNSQSPSDLTALTPGHFLIGSPILAPLEPEVSQTPISIQNRWQRIKTLHQHFCSRWKNEYLKELQKRTKWKKPEENLKEEMLVVVKEENLPPNSWRLGRIIKVHRGDDKRVRVAEVLTQRGTITRPITKLVVISDESS